jgi:hypothetical protein
VSRAAIYRDRLTALWIQVSVLVSVFFLVTAGLDMALTDGDLDGGCLADAVRRQAVGRDRGAAALRRLE